MRGARISYHHVCHPGLLSLTVVFRSVSVHEEALKTGEEGGVARQRGEVGEGGEG